MTDLKKIASLLQTTMASTGIFDDYDEVLQDQYDIDPQGAERFHEGVLEAVLFLNEQLYSENTTQQFIRSSFQKEWDNLLSKSK